jgi:hypothetical protein
MEAQALLGQCCPVLRTCLLPFTMPGLSGKEQGAAEGYLKNPPLLSGLARDEDAQRTDGADKK